MKNKKSLLSLGLLALVLVLGVGYAVVSAVDLSISGTAAAATEDLAVEFTNVTINPGDENYFEESETTIGNGLTANIKVKDLVLNKPVSVTYTITNNETDVTAKVTQKTIENSNGEYFTVETDKTAETPIEIKPENTMNVKVTVTLHKTPVEAASNSTSITIPFVAEAVNNANTTE